MNSQQIYRNWVRQVFFLRLAGIAALFGILASISPPAMAEPDQEPIIMEIKDLNPNRSNSGVGGAGGRVNGLASVAGNNQVFYAASEWGGLFKTTNGGHTWFRLDRHLPAATWDIEVDPLDPNRVYATSFPDGRVASLAGINVSKDAGNTWIHPNVDLPGNCAPINREIAYGISIDPRNPDRVYIAANCGLAISTNRGDSWTVVDPVPGGNPTSLIDVVVHYNESGQQIIDVCGGEGHSRLTEGGAGWVPTAGLPSDVMGLNCSLDVSPDESYVLFVTYWNTFAQIGRIFESDNAGMTWHEFTNPDSALGFHGRIPFVATNQRSSARRPDGSRLDRFDLWFGDVNLYRIPCQTPDVKEPGSDPLKRRCPDSSAWLPGLEGGHADLGDVVFDEETTALDSCPLIMSSDGGVYFNTRTLSTTPNCQQPFWEQPEVAPHALWIWGLDGADQPDPLLEDLYFGTQDNGLFGTRDAGSPIPWWHNGACCDQFDVVAERERVVTTDQNGRFLLWGRGLNGVSQIVTPGLATSGFKHPDGVDRFGSGKYVIITGMGVFITDNITTQPDPGWKPLSQAMPPPGLCSVQAAVPPSSPDIPTFYFQAGRCMSPPENPNGDQLWRFTGTDPAGSWQPITLPDGGGVGIFAVDPNNPNRLYASLVRADMPPRMIFSNDGGATWQQDLELDKRMSGDGAFKLKTENGPTDETTFFGYTQPSLVAFDPEDPNILVAGGRDSGVFLTTNGGKQWKLVTDPFDSGSSGIPHLPRPWHAYFDHEPAGVVTLYIGTEGRGVWRIRFTRR